MPDRLEMRSRQAGGARANFVDGFLHGCVKFTVHLLTFSKMVCSLQPIYTPKWHPKFSNPDLAVNFCRIWRSIGRGELCPAGGRRSWEVRPENQKEMVDRRLELRTLGLLDPRSNQLS